MCAAAASDVGVAGGAAVAAAAAVDVYAAVAVGVDTVDVVDGIVDNLVDTSFDTVKSVVKSLVNRIIFFSQKDSEVAILNIFWPEYPVNEAVDLPVDVVGEGVVDKMQRAQLSQAQQQQRPQHCQKTGTWGPHTLPL